MIKVPTSRGIRKIRKEGEREREKGPLICRKEAETQEAETGHDESDHKKDDSGHSTCTSHLGYCLSPTPLLLALVLMMGKPSSRVTFL